MSAAIRHLSAIVLIAACGGANAEQAEPSLRTGRRARLR